MWNFAPQQQIQQSNPIRDYVFAMVAVVIIAILWIVFNEAVMGIADVGLGMVTGTGADMINFLIAIYRITPIFMIVAVWLYCFFRAFKREPFEQFVG